MTGSGDDDTVTITQRWRRAQARGHGVHARGKVMTALSSRKLTDHRAGKGYPVTSSRCNPQKSLLTCGAASLSEPLFAGTIAAGTARSPSLGQASTCQTSAEYGTRVNTAYTTNTILWNARMARCPSNR